MVSAMIRLPVDGISDMTSGSSAVLLCFPSFVWPKIRYQGQQTRTSVA